MRFPRFFAPRPQASQPVPPAQSPTAPADVEMTPEQAAEVAETAQRIAASIIADSIQRQRQSVDALEEEVMAAMRRLTVLTQGAGRSAPQSYLMRQQAQRVVSLHTRLVEEWTAMHDYVTAQARTCVALAAAIAQQEAAGTWPPEPVPALHPAVLLLAKGKRPHG